MDPSADGVPRELDRGLLALSTRRPVAVLMVVTTVLMFGLISFRQLPRNLMPDIAYPSITVRTDYPGAAPIDVEDRISERLEGVLSQVKNLKRISSISRAELSEIVLEFAWGTNMAQATMEVREKVDQVYLPDIVERPIILRYDPTLDPILQLGFYAEREAGLPPMSPEQETHELIALRTEAEEVIQRELEMVPGVAAIQVRGGLEKELRIDVDEGLLQAKGISMSLIATRLRDENQNLASGVLYEGDDALIVRSVNEFEDLEEIRDIVVRQEAGVPLKLRDVARVYFGFKDPEVLTRFNGSPCVTIELYKEADANIVETATGIRRHIFGNARDHEILREIERRDAEKAELAKKKAAEKKAAKGDEDKEEKKEAKEKKEEKGLFSGEAGLRRPRFLTSLLDPQKRVVVMSDPAQFIERSLSEVNVTVVTGGVLAILVLYLFLRNLWFTAIVGMAIPLSVIATFAAMRIFGVSLNIMSLGGLALGVGMLVDNSIVVLESIFRCRETGDSPRHAAVRGGRMVSTAVTASTLTTVAVFFPIVFVEGIAGQVFRDQALAVVISLVVSLAVSLTFIPTLVSRRLSFVSPGSASTSTGRPGFEFHAWRKIRGLFSGRSIWWLPLSIFLLLLHLSELMFECVGSVVQFLTWLALRTLALAVAFAARVFGPATGRIFASFDSGWNRIEAVYPRLIQTALLSRSAVLFLAAAGVAGALWLFGGLGSELIPEVHQGEFTVELTLPVGTRIEETDKIVQPLERGIRGLPGVRSVTGTIGVEKDSLKAGEQGEHTAQLLVRIDEDLPPLETEERLKASIRERLAGIPELLVKIRNPVLFSFKTPIEVEIRGYRLDDIRRAADSLAEAMANIPSIEDVKSSVRRGYPEIRLAFRRDIMVRHDLDVGTIGNAIRQKIDGEVATRFSEGDRKLDVRVRLQEEDRSSYDDLAAMIVNPGDPVKLPLEYVAEITQDYGPSEIRRIGQSRAAVVTANLSNLDLGRVSREIGSAVEELDLPRGLAATFGGQHSEMEASRQSLLWALALAVFLVYVVMAAQFESLVQPFVILFTIPLAFVGVALLLWSLDITLNVVVFIGMIVLAGIVVNNAIVLIDTINQLRRGGMAKREAIAKAAGMRLRPILMTSLTTILGLVPLTGGLNWIPGATEVFGVGEGLEIRAPMALTVIAGLLSATVLTLVVLPVVYSLSDRRD